MAEPKAAGPLLAEPEAESARAWIEVVPPSDEPELPIPSPPAPPPAIALVGTAAVLPSPFVTPAEDAPAAPSADEAPAAVAEPAPPPPDPLAALMALTPEERQALFT